MRTSNKLLIIIAIILLNSCSFKQWRCSRIVAKAQRLNCITFNNDTFYSIDTVKGFYIDTIFKTDSFKNIDTFTLVKDNIKVRTIVNYKDKIVYQTIRQKDTIIIRKLIKPTPKITPARPRWKTILIYLLLFIAMAKLWQYFKSDQ